MDTLTYPAKSLGYRLYGGADQPQAPILIPGEITSRSTSYGARESHRRQRVHVVAAAVVAAIALAVLAYAVL